MIEEDYVSLETAKLLREKGFDEPCRSAYIWNTEKYELCALFSKPLHFNRESGLEDYEDDSVPRISAPTQQMAMRWLREAHGKIILINFYREERYSYDILLDGECGDNYIIYSAFMFEHYQSYEEAVEAALKYCLTKLI